MKIFYIIGISVVAAALIIVGIFIYAYYKTVVKAAEQDEYDPKKDFV